MGGLWRPWAAWLLGSRRGKRRRARTARRRERPFRRLAVERLEDRSLLAATLVGTVWQDLNSDGQQAGGEPAVQFAVAELFSSANGTIGDSDDVSLGTRITDAAGNYQFTGLAAGVNHYVVIRPPVGFAFTVQDTGPDATDSDVGATGRSAMFAPVDLSTVDLDAGLTGAAPGFGWAVQQGGVGYSEAGRSVAVDAAGYSYVAGRFNGTADFDSGPGTYILTSAGASSVDVHVAKYTPGGALVWARRVGGTSDDYGYGVAVDAAGNALVTGSFQGTVDFDPGAGVANLTSAGGSDVFVLKLDAGGNYQWAGRVGGASSDVGRDVAVDVAGNVFVVGEFAGTVDFDPGAGVANLLGSGGWDAFVFKLDAAGALQWARCVGGTNNDIGYGVAVDTTGSALVTGSFWGTADFDPGAGTASLTSAGNADAFVLKLDAGGAYEWAARIGGTSSDSGYGVAVDSAGNVLVTGYFVGTADFDPGAGSANLTSVGSDDAFVLKLDSGGNFQWAGRVGGTSTDVAYGVAVDSGGSVLIAGSFWDTVDFDPGDGTANLTSAGSNDAFVLRLDAGGNYQWARRVGGTSTDVAYGVAVDAAGSVLIAGTLWGTVDFDAGAGTFNLTSAGGSDDGFLWRLATSEFVPEINLVGNGQSIISGASTPSRGDYTDFSAALVVVGAQSRTFTIQNLGMAALRLTGTPWVQLSGPHAADFTVSVLPAGLIYEGQSTAFQITFDPSALGLRTATVTILSNDADEGNYTFAIQGIGAEPATVEGTVWHDLNGDGVQTGGEPGILYAVVELFDTVDGVAGNADDLSLGVRITPASGSYQFAGVIAGGSYSLAVRPPMGFAFTTQDAGGNDALDSDVGATGLSALFAPADLATVDLDAGLSGAAPAFGWAAQQGGAGYFEAGRSVAVDAADYSYLAGCFNGTADFDSGPGTYNLTSAGASSDDVYVAKYAPGGALVWARRVGGTGTDVGYGMAVDASGNVLVTGNFAGTADFDPGEGVATLTSAGGNDAFVLKLDAGGAYQWAHRVGGTSTSGDSGHGVAVDASGSVLVAGYFAGTVDFDPGAGTANLTSDGGRDAFVLKLNAGGGYQWASRVGWIGNDHGYSVVADSAGNALVVGAFEYTVDFDPGAGTANLTSAGGYDAFVLKLDAAGAYQWAGRVGGALYDYGYGVAVEASGNNLVTGYFQDTADFDPGAGISNLTSAGSDDVFILKLDAEGNYQWARRVGGTSADVAYGVAVDASSNVVVTGSFRGTADFDPSVEMANLTSSGVNDAFVVTLDAGGGYQWARRVGGTSTDVAYGVAVDASGNVVVTGSFWATADFDPGAGTFNLTSAVGSDDGFLWWLTTDEFAPETNLMGNGQSIVSGDSTPALADHTNFGQATVAGGTQFRAFTIQNLGTAVLLLTGTPKVQVAGPHAADFTVTLLPAGSISESQSTTFQITFAPSAAGLRQATVTILSNDGDEGSYTFAIQGTGLASFDPAAVMGTVWHDRNGDGQQTGGEPGVLYAVVELFDTVDGVAGNADDLSRGARVTDASGNYHFAGLTHPGSYFVVVRPPAGFGFAAQDAGGSDALDSDVSNQGLSNLFTLSSGQALDLDAGLTGTAPGFGWATRQGAASDDVGRALAVDGAGFSFVTGSFQQTVDLDPGPGSFALTSSGGRDAYVAKFAPTGALVWARRLGSSSDDDGNDVAVDASGNVLVTGAFQATVDFDPGLGALSLTSAGYEDIFVWKLSNDGNLIWARRAGSDTTDVGRGLTVDGEGNVLVVGAIGDTVDFDPGPGTVNLSYSGGVVWKLSSAGELAWAVATEGTGFAQAHDVDVDLAGNVLVTGYLSRTEDFDPGAGTAILTSASGTIPDIFVWKLSSGGEYVWARRAGGSGWDEGTSLAVDTSGSVFVTGYFNGTVDFDPGAGSLQVTSSGGGDVFVWKLTSAGNLAWIRRTGGGNNDQGWGVTVDQDGNALLTGNFNGTADFDPGAGTFNLTGSWDVFVWKLTAAGDLSWARSAGGSDFDYGYGIAVDAASNVWVTGVFKGLANFDPSGGTANLTSGGLDDAFLVRWNGSLFAPKINVQGNGQTIVSGDLVPAMLDYTDFGSRTVDAGQARRSFTIANLGTTSLELTGTPRVAISGAHAEDFSVTSLPATVVGFGSSTTFEIMFDPSAAGLRTATVTIVSNDSDEGSYTFAIQGVGLVGFAPATVQGAVWRDQMPDGVRQGGEPGVPHSVVELFDTVDGVAGNADDVSLGTRVTDAGGGYEFSGLTQTGPFHIVVRGPAGFGFTAQDAGGDDAADSDVSSLGLSNPFTLSSGQVLNLGAGLIGTAPGFGWAARQGSTGDDDTRAIVVDAAGFNYVTGRFSGTVDFDPGPGIYNLTSAGIVDIVVARFTPGGALVWARRAGGASTDRGIGLTLDAGGNVLVTGAFGGTVDFDPGPATFNLTSAGGDEVFVWKLSAAGELVWAVRAGSTNTDVGWDVGVDASGAVLVTGYFSTTADFDPGAGTANLTSAGSFDIFVWKLTEAGDLSWVRRAGSTGDDWSFELALDPAGSVLVAGRFTDNVDFDPGPGTAGLTSAGASDIVVWKLSSAGDFVWVRAAGGTGNDGAAGVALDAAGNVLVTGFFQSTVDFDPGVGTLSLASAGVGDAFVWKLSGAGDMLWAVRTGGTSDDAGVRLAVDGSGDVYVTGYFQSTVDFDPGTGIQSLNSAGVQDAFLWKLTSAGGLAWVHRLGGTTADEGYELALDGAGYVLLAGYFGGTVDFGPGTAATANLTGGGGRDGFLLRWSIGYVAPEIHLVGNGLPIASGDATPAQSDHTDFGSRLVSLGQVSRTFTLQNLGVSAVNLTGTPLVQLTGPHAADFTVTTLPSGAINDGQSTSFQITFDPSAPGLRTATVTIQSNDADEGSYAFAIQGTGLASFDPAAVSGTVWHDLNGDGVQQGGEPGVQYAVVDLFDTVDGVAGNADDVLLGTQLTAVGGQYLFSGLSLPGWYYAVVRPPVGFGFTIQDAGGDDALDSDVSGVGLSSAFALVSGQTFDLDAGLTGAAPGFGWAASLGDGAAFALGRTLATDADGNVWLTGSFSGTLDFDPGPGVFQLTGAGSNDIFVASYSPTGAFRWAGRIGGTGDDQGQAVALDSSGNVLVTGFFSGTVDFDPGAAVFSLTSAGVGDVFVLKLDGLGSFVWARSAGGLSTERGFGVAVDASGSVLVTGDFVGTADFDPGPGTFNLTSAGSNEVFVWKLSAAGDLVWAVRAGGTSVDIGNAVAVDAAGNVAVTGSFQGTADFDPGAGLFNLTSAGSSDAFLWRLDTSGNLAWALSLGSSSGSDIGTGVAVDAAGNVLVTGEFTGTVDFDPGPGVANLTSAGVQDIFIAKYSATGSLQWRGQIGGTATESSGRVLTDAAGGVVVSGRYQANTDLDPGAGVANLSTGGSFDVFAVRLTAAGGLVWARGVGGPGSDSPAALGLDASGSVLLAGAFLGTADFDPGPGTANRTAVGLSDGFLLKLNSGGDYLWAHQLGDNANVVQRDAVVASDGSLLVTGSFEGTPDFDPGPGITALTADRSADAFVARYTAAGALVWARRLGGASADQGNRLTVDAPGNVVIVGSFQGTVDFDPGTGLFNLTSAGSDDAFVLKLDAGGNLVWARRVGGTSADTALAVVLDAAGNLVVTGYFSSTVDFDPGAGTVNLTSAGGASDAFALKLDAAGTYVWAAGLGSTGTDVANEPALDAAGNVFLVGAFQGTVDFDPGAGVFNLTSAGSDDAFLVRLAADGSFLGAQRFGSTSTDRGSSLVLDAAGRPALLGSFAGTVDFDPGAGVFNLTSASGIDDVFLAQFDASGGLLWVGQLGATGTDVARRVVRDAAGNFLVTGSFSGTLDADPGPQTALRTSAGSWDAFLASLDSMGRYRWAQRFGGTSGDEPHSVAVDAVGNVVAVGLFRDTVDFDLGPGTFSLVGGANSAGFVVRLLAGQFVPKINVVGSGLSIASGDTTPSIADHTDFGSRPVAAGQATRWFAAENTGLALLNLTGTPRIEIGGPHAADFTVTVLPNAAINDGQSSTFQLTFDPSAPGLRTATVTIVSDDADEPTYTFAIQGTGLASFDPATVSGTVWRDQNGDGVQQAGEPGMQYAVVELFDTVDGVAGNADDLSLGVQVTTASGGYQFTGLAHPGAYHFAVRPPVGFGFTAPDVGDDALDSDVSTVGLSGPHTLASGQSLDLDAGLTGTAPAFGWSAQTGGSGTDDGRAVALDALGYVYVTGRFGGTVDFDPGPGTYNLASAGGDDIYVARYAPGGALVWARRAGGTGIDQGRGLAVDSSGNLLVTGSFNGTVDFDPGPGTFNLTSAGLSDAFVWKLTAAGELVWAVRAGGISTDGGYGLAVDAAGGVLVTGEFSDTVDFDPSPATFSLTSAGFSDVFIWKLTAAGDLVWARPAGGTSTDQGLAVVVDAAAHVLVTGRFVATVDFDPGTGTLNLTSAGNFDVFVWKLTAAGDLVWAQGVGGASGADSGLGVALDAAGNVLVVGSYTGTVDFDPGAGTANLTSAGGTDAFVLRLDAAGGYQWARGVGGAVSDQALGVTVDAAGRVLVVGSFQDTVDFDPGAGTASLTSAGGSDAFVLRLDAAGGYHWAQQVGGASSDIAYAVAIDTGGRVLVVGSFQNTADFDPGAGTFNLTSAGGIDGFLWQFAPASFLPPTVTGVFVRGTGDASGSGNDEWLAAYLTHLGTQGLGDAALGYRVSVGADQLDSLPWTNVDTVSIRFSEGVTVVSGNLQVLGAAEGPAVPAVASFSYNASTFTATWQFATALPANKYLLHIATGVVVGLDTFALDGEWTDGVSTASGNAAAGGAFAFRMNVVPGDVNGDTVTTQSVTNADVLLTKQALSTDVSAGAAYLFRRDVNASGAITNADVLQAKQRLSTSIFDYSEPVPPPPGESFGEESLAAARLTEPWHTNTLLDEPAVAPSSMDAALAEPVAPEGTIDLDAWDAAILAMYGKKK